MSDTTLTEHDDDEDIVAVEAPSDAKEPVAADEGEGDDGDERLGDNAEDSDAEIAGEKRESKNNKKRKKQRELRRRAKEFAERELEYLRQQNSELARRVQAVEGHAMGANVSQLDAQFSAAQHDIRQAEYVIAKAVEAGNGEDVAAAIRLRDEAQMRAAQIQSAKAQAETAQRQAMAPQADPRVVSYAQEWLKANPWYNQNGTDEDSLITKAIDSALAREGWNPSTEAYWHELTRRVTSRIGNEKEEKVSKKEKSQKRKAPPMGTDREHVTAAGKNEIFISKERKDAMIEAGVWDDPALRKRYLKAYQSYDRGASR